MKKIIMLPLVLLLLGGCAATYYVENGYHYNEFYQKYEPYRSVSDDHDAARYIARQLNRYFRQDPYKRIAVLNFTDEYGEMLNRGVRISDRIASELSRNRNLWVIDRRMLYETVYEMGYTYRGLIVNKGYQLRTLAGADYVLHGRVMPGVWEDAISVRCFEVETGRVVFATTLYVERHYSQRPPGPRPPRPPHPPRPPRPHPEPPSQRDPGENDDGQSTIKKPGEKRDPIETIGKKPLENEKPSSSDQIQYKKKPAEETNDTSGSVPKEIKKEDANTKTKQVKIKGTSTKKVEIKEEEKTVTPEETQKKTTSAEQNKKTGSTTEKVEIREAEEETDIKKSVSPTQEKKLPVRK
ncbi:MAG: hypothetical protein K0B52_03460 [FCB group bacterium]|nr:hypothetical protein [FCB group bacterium]